MKKYGFISIIVLLLLMCCSKQSEEPLKLTVFVNPFIGTDGPGNTYPGATVPFGMVQLSPDIGIPGWDRIAGYYYKDSIISGFSHTHLTGTGAGTMTATANIDFQIGLRRRKISNGVVTNITTFPNVRSWGLTNCTYVFNYLDTTSGSGDYEYFLTIASFNVYSGAQYLVIGSHSITYLEVRR